MTEHDDKKKAAQPKQVPNAEGNVHVDVIMGPYRGNRLTMIAADGQAAINAHWAVDPFAEYPGHEPLTDQQRTDAFAASHAWAQAQQDALLEKPPAPPEARRDMKPQGEGEYKTRQAEPPKAPQERAGHPEPPRR